MAANQRQKNSSTLYGITRNENLLSTISNGISTSTVCTCQYCHVHRNLEQRMVDTASGHTTPNGSMLDLQEITVPMAGYSPRLQDMRRSRTMFEDQNQGETKKKKREAMKLKRLIILIAIFVGYVCIGAIVFNTLEAGPEKDRKDAMDIYVLKFLERNPCVNKSDLYELMSKSVEDSEIVYYIVENKTHLDRWDFSGAFGFVVSVVTTIGFGNLAPFTLAGKIVTVMYAIFGIPLTLIMLGGIGEKMAGFVNQARKCKNPMCHHTPRVNKLLNAVVMVSFGMVLVFILPSIMFTYVEKWHFLESLYFCFTTLSTIGFGDYIIGLHETRFTSLYLHEFYEVIAYVWILLGLAYLSLVYRYLTDIMVAKAQKVEKSTIRRLGTELNLGSTNRGRFPQATAANGEPRPEGSRSRSTSPRLERVPSETVINSGGVCDAEVDLDD